jgi:hypothetical protein
VSYPKKDKISSRSSSTSSLSNETKKQRKILEIKGELSTSPPANKGSEKTFGISVSGKTKASSPDKPKRAKFDVKSNKKKATPELKETSNKTISTLPTFDLNKQLRFQESNSLDDSKLSETDASKSLASSREISGKVRMEVNLNLKSEKRQSKSSESDSVEKNLKLSNSLYVKNINNSSIPQLNPLRSKEEKPKFKIEGSIPKTKRKNLNQKKNLIEKKNGFNFSLAGKSPQNLKTSVKDEKIKSPTRKIEGSIEKPKAKIAGSIEKLKAKIAGSIEKLKA